MDLSKEMQDEAIEFIADYLVNDRAFYPGNANAVAKGIASELDKQGFVFIDKGTLEKLIRNRSAVRMVADAVREITEEQDKEELKGYELQNDPTEIPGERDQWR